MAGALDFVDGEVGRFSAELKAKGLSDSTAIVLSAKHGQSPKDPAALTRIDDGKLIDGLNAAWKQARPGAGDLVAMATDDDVVMMWLTDRGQAAADFAKKYLLSASGTGTDVNGNPKAFTGGGLTKVYAGQQARDYFGVGKSDQRVPDLFGIRIEHTRVLPGLCD